MRINRSVRNSRFLLQITSNSCVLERAPQGAPQGVLHLIRYRFPRHSSSWSFQSAFHNRKNDARGGKKEHAVDTMRH